MNIFVGNLSFDAKEIDVQRFFRAFGVVTSVAIVMEKKGKKSRGFGFVEMPDEQEALSAIEGLHDKEILGRPVNVMASLPKNPKSEHVEAKQKSSFERTGKYKEGRRSISYVKKRIDAGVTVPVPERKFKANPMRWRKKPRWSSSSQKPQGEIKPWEKPEGSQSKPLKKAESGAKPWRKSSDTRKQPSFRKRISSASHKK